jgi:hypothetical protein
MTLRERLADWISGGALTRANERQNRAADATFAQIDKTIAFMDRAFDAEGALRAIAAMETPGANATVRRMARTAREALK